MCERKYIKATINSVQMAGVLAGSLLAGQSADTVGRRITCYVTMTIHALTSFVAGLSVSWPMYAVLRSEFLPPVLLLFASNFPSVLFKEGPRGLTSTWWVCYGLCLIKPTELAHSFLLCVCVYFCLYGPFNCISFHGFSRQLSVFWLCSSGFISVLLILSTIYIYFL